jgi:hypothetical protein
LRIFSEIDLLMPAPQIVFPHMPERLPPSLQALQAIRRGRRLRIL